VTGLTVSGAAGPDDSISMRFTSSPLRPLVRGAGSPPQRVARVYRFPDACPSGRPSGRPVAEIYVTGTTTRAQVESRLEVAPGRWCYAVWLTDGARRVARAPAVATVDVRRVGPTAGISAPDPAVAGDDVYFEDASDYGEARELTYRWDFGDPATPGATSADAFASHAYATPGTYVVTLTVTDESGQSSTATHTIRIDPPESFP
jgi:hypothetical protein